MHDGLATAHDHGVIAEYGQLVAARGQGLTRGLGDTALDHHIATSHVQLCEARGFESGLDVHAVIHHVRYELRVRLGLIESAHDSESDTHTRFLHEARNNRV